MEVMEWLTLYIGIGMGFSGVALAFTLATTKTTMPAWVVLLILVVCTISWPYGAYLIIRGRR